MDWSKYEIWDADSGLTRIACKRCRAEKHEDIFEVEGVTISAVMAGVTQHHHQNHSAALQLAKR